MQEITERIEEAREWVGGEVETAREATASLAGEFAGYFAAISYALTSLKNFLETT